MAASGRQRVQLGQNSYNLSLLLIARLFPLKGAQTHHLGKTAEDFANLLPWDLQQCSLPLSQKALLAEFSVSVPQDRTKLFW